MNPKVLITLSGGLVTGVLTNLPECTFIVVDFDMQFCEEEVVSISQPEEQHGTFKDGEAYLYFQDMLSTDEELVAAEKLEQMNY